MFSVQVFLIIAAFVCTVVSAMGKCPLWVAVLLLVVLEMLRAFPAK